jgi:hypothetical protein
MFVIAGGECVLDRLWAKALCRFRTPDGRSAGAPSPHALVKRRSRSAPSPHSKTSPPSHGAILPPQNAAGNWIKIVQRVPVRIEFEAGQDLRRLRAGMSATVEIDTGRRGRLARLFGSSAVAQDPEQ